MPETFRKNENITSQNKILSNDIEMDIREFLKMHKIGHFPCPMIRENGKKNFDYKMAGKWSEYARLSKKGKKTHRPYMNEFKEGAEEALTEEDIEFRHKHYEETDTGVINTWQVLHIDIDSPDYDPWLEELIKTAPYYKSLTKDFGKHIFVKIKEGQSIKKTAAAFDDKASRSGDTEHHGLGKIEILNGKLSYFDINQKVINGKNPIPVIDLDEHPLEGKKIKEVKEEGKKELMPRDIAKLTEYTNLIDERFWKNFDHWFKIMCCWKHEGATFEQFQEVSLKKAGNKDNNAHHWESMETPYKCFRDLHMYALKSDQEKTIQLDNKYNSFEKFDKYKFQKMRATNHEHTLYSNMIKDTVEEIRNIVNEKNELEAQIKDEKDIKKKRALKKELKEKKKELSDAEEQVKQERDKMGVFQQKECNDTYRVRKQYFERFHFKVIDPICYARKRYTDFQLYKKTEFKEVYNYLTYPYIKNPEDGIEVEMPFIDAWLKDINILEFNKVDFLPPPLHIPEETHNLFCGLAVETYMNEAGSNDYQIFLDHIRSLVGNEDVLNFPPPWKNDETHPWNEWDEWDQDRLRKKYNNDICYDYVVKYNAHMVQQIGKKPCVALTFLGTQGSGKSMFWGNLGRQLLGAEYTLQSARINDFIGTFAKVNHKILVICEETDTSDTFKNAGLLKDLATCEYAMFEKKCKDALEQRSVLRLIKLTNSETLNIELNDRRECIFRTLDDNVISMAGGEKEKQRRSKYFADLHKAFQSKSRVYAFYKYLKNIDLTGWDVVKQRPLTRSYYDIQSVNIPVYLRFLNHKCKLGNAGVCETDGDPEPIEILFETLFEEFQLWISTNKPKNKEKTNSTSMGRWLGKHPHLVTKKRVNKGSKVKYTIDILAVRIACEKFAEFLY